jgi:hypothetical protein
MIEERLTTHDLPCRSRVIVYSIYPNGKIGILVLILAIFGYCLGAFANNNCFFVTVDLTGTDYFQGSQDAGFGFRFREDVTAYYCVPYSQDEIDYFFDATWKAARAMALIANICGGVTLIITICLSCVSMPKTFLNFTTFLSAAAGFFQCLTFIAFSSDICKNFNCQFAWGAGCAIGAFLLYFVNACLLYKIPMYQGTEDGLVYDNRPAAAVATSVNPPPGSVQTRVEVMSDGTKKTTRTTINAGTNFFCTYMYDSLFVQRLSLISYSLQMDPGRSRRL